MGLKLALPTNTKNAFKRKDGETREQLDYITPGSYPIAASTAKRMNALLSLRKMPHNSFFYDRSQKNVV